MPWLDIYEHLDFQNQVFIGPCVLHLQIARLMQLLIKNIFENLVWNQVFIGAGILHLWIAGMEQVFVDDCVYICE